MNLIQITTNLKTIQNNVNKCGKRISQVTHTKCDVFFSLNFESNFP